MTEQEMLVLVDVLKKQRYGLMDQIAALQHTIEMMKQTEAVDGNVRSGDIQPDAGPSNYGGTA